MQSIIFNALFLLINIFIFIKILINLQNYYILYAKILTNKTTYLAILILYIFLY